MDYIYNKFNKLSILCFSLCARDSTLGLVGLVYASIID